ncbi:MAG TPA: hypothetical protein VF803_00420 [Candidatus Paceibacterota bacterium]
MVQAVARALETIMGNAPLLLLRRLDRKRTLLFGTKRQTLTLRHNRAAILGSSAFLVAGAAIEFFLLHGTSVD